MLSLIALSTLYNAISAKLITCNTDDSSNFYNLQFDKVTSQSFGGSITYDIGWKKVMLCDEGTSNGLTFFPTAEYMNSIAPYAITMEIVPNDFSYPQWDDFAVYAKVCTNPVIALNNLKEVSYTIDVNTFTATAATDLNNWYGLNGATSRLSQTAANCPLGSAPDSIDTSVFRSCGNINSLQMSNSKCQWDQLTTGKNIAVYLGFDLNKDQMCDGAGNGGLQYVSGRRRTLMRELNTNHVRTLSTTNARPRRRRLTNWHHNVTGELLNNGACITIEISLETENLLPSNNEPDAPANIAMIGKALSGDCVIESSINDTASEDSTCYDITMTMPEVLDPALEDIATTAPPGGLYPYSGCIDSCANVNDGLPHQWCAATECTGFVQCSNGYMYHHNCATLLVYDDNLKVCDYTSSTCDQVSYPESDLIWVTDPKCRDNNQIQESFLQSQFNQESLDATTVADSDGFTITVPYTTNASNFYVFEVDALPLTISHTCSNAISIVGYLYKDTVEIDATEEILVPPNESGVNTEKSLPFPETVVLQPNTAYEFVFVGIYEVNGAPNVCDDTQVTVGTNRRRLLDDFSWDDFGASAEPNACVLGTSLARSNAMQLAMTSLCSGDASANIDTVESAMFQSHASDFAMNTFLVASGSLHIYNSDGTLALPIIDDWPVGVTDPCIAIDEENLRVYAVGGYVTGTTLASDAIQVYQFTDSSMAAGAAVPYLEGWVLDKPRYGSTCLIWKQFDSRYWLVVVSGMSDTRYELTDKKQFYDDIRAFRVPKNSNQMSNWGGYSMPEDSIGTKTVAKPGVIDSRPIMIDNHILYFFGGKTHSASKSFVWRFDLEDLMNANSAALETLTLTESRALPIVDRVTNVDGQPCYAIFAGQLYEQNSLVSDGINLENIQLMCNPEIISARRRAMMDDSDLLTPFDRVMFEKLKQNRRRMTASQEEEEETEIFIRNYEYALDGVWYDFNVELELCYDSNDNLTDAKQNFEDIIAAKPNGQAWIDFAQETSDTVLNESLHGYQGWSNGFGAVNVYDLEIVDINYYNCRPIVQIHINSGCTEANFEFSAVTDVVYTDMQYYNSVHEIGDPDLFTSTPSDALSQIILDHSCDTDTVTSAQTPGLDLLRLNDASYKKHIYGSNIEENSKKSVPSNGGGYGWEHFAITVLPIYNLIVSIVVLKAVIYCKPLQKERLSQKQIIV